MKALHAFWSLNLERCGFVLQDDSIVEVQNHAENPEAEFEISQADFSAYAGSIKATWHTHTDDSPNLSLSDYYSFLTEPTLAHYVVSENYVVRFVVESENVLVDEVTPI